MTIKEFDQNTTLSDPKLPSDALSSKQFITIVDVVSEGQIAGFATPHKRGIATNNSAYLNAAKTDIFLNKTLHICMFCDTCILHHIFYRTTFDTLLLFQSA